MTNVKLVFFCFLPIYCKLSMQFTNKLFIKFEIHALIADPAQVHILDTFRPQCCFLLTKMQTKIITEMAGVC